MRRVAAVVVCLLVGCSSSSGDPAPATGTDSAVGDTATLGDSVATDTATDKDSAATDAPSTDGGAGCAADDFTNFTFSISVKKDGAALTFPATARRKCVATSKELDMDFGDQTGPLPNGAYKFRISLLGKTKQPTDDGFTLADATTFPGSIVLYEGSASGIPTAYQNVGTPTTETLSVSGGKLTYHYKGTYVENLKTTPTFVLEVDIVDAPLK